MQDLEKRWQTVKNSFFSQTLPCRDKIRPGITLSVIRTLSLFKSSTKFAIEHNSDVVINLAEFGLDLWVRNFELRSTT